MIKRLIAVTAVLSVMSLYGCSKDCKVCTDMGEEFGGKQCTTVKDVKKSDCEDCNVGDEPEELMAAKALGMVECKVK